MNSIVFWEELRGRSQKVVAYSDTVSAMLSMMIKLKDITPIDLYMYSLAMTLEQPFSPEDLLVKIQIEHPE